MQKVTIQRDVEKLAAGKVMATIKTCLSCCSNCKRGTIVKLRNDVAKLFNKALEKGEKRD